MNQDQVKEALRIANSPEFSGVEVSELKDWRSLKTTVCVSIAEVAAVIKHEKLSSSDFAKFRKCGQHYIRVTDFLPAEKTAEFCEKLRRGRRLSDK